MKAKPFVKWAGGKAKLLLVYKDASGSKIANKAVITNYKVRR